MLYLQNYVVYSFNLSRVLIAQRILEILWKNWSSSSSQLSWHWLLDCWFTVPKVLQKIHRHHLPSLSAEKSKDI